MTIPAIIAVLVVASAIFWIGYLLGCRDGFFEDEDEAAERAFDQGYRIGELAGYDRGLNEASPSVVKELPS